MDSKRSQRLVFVTLFLSSVPMILQAQEEAKGRIIWKYDHAGINENRTKSVRLSPGEKFTVEIVNTEPSNFEYRMSEVKGEPTTALKVKTTTWTLTDYYDPTYGAYLISIELKPGKKSKTLNNVILIVKVERLGWEIEFAGSFTISNVTDPVYATQTRSANGSEQQFVIREEEKENSARLGIAAFIHVFHNKFSKLAWTFGLGIQSDNKVSYYLGPTFRFNNKAAITGGAVWASVTTLPAGTVVGQPAPNANVLNNLSTKIDRGWFVGFSYTFIKVADSLQKPFNLPKKKS